LNDLLVNSSEILSVDFILELKLKLVVSSGDIRVYLVFLGLSDLCIDGILKIVEKLKKLSLKLNPS
jgi:hypothetical protein